MDTNGNLTWRSDAYADNTNPEYFCYDRDSRMTNTGFGGSGCKGGTNYAVGYDGIGNILYKTDINDAATCSDSAPCYLYGSRPHAVASIAPCSGCFVDGIAGGAGNTANFFYDANGNLLCVTARSQCNPYAARSQSWTSFDMASAVTQGGTSISYTYDPSHARASQTESIGGTITNYADYPEIGVMAERIDSGGQLTWRNYVMADGQMVAIRLTIANKNPAMYYPILDHLGSMAAVVDGNAIGITGANPNYGQVIDRYSYDAFGMARDPVNWKPLDCSKGSQPPFARGFTGQEHLPDNVCLINFNARMVVYPPAALRADRGNPQIARFLSADPTVEALYDGQDLNRYSYVANNPLGFTDASGLCFLGCVYKSPIFGAALDIGLFFFGLPELEVLTNLATIGGTATTAYAAASAANLTVINAGIAGGLSGAVTSGRLKGALLGAAQGAAMAGVAPSLSNSLGTVIANPVADDFIAHGFVGGLFSIGQKGGFVSGFLAAGVGSLPAPVPLGQFATGLEMATLGGAASVLGGGKFANGAVTAAFSYAAGIMASPHSGLNDGPNESNGVSTGSKGSPDFTNDPSVRAALGQAWADSDPDASSVPEDQCCSFKHEQGGWIIKWAWDGYDALRVGPGTRDTLPTIVGTRPEWCVLVCSVEGWFHTHPNWNSEGYDGYRASPGDIEFTRGYAKVPGIIITHQSPIIIPYP